MQTRNLLGQGVLLCNAVNWLALGEMTMRTWKRDVVLFAASVLGCCGAVAGQDQPETKPGNTVRPAIHWKRFDYTCENGVKVVVFLHDTAARVRFQDQAYLMKQTMSADGNRYSDGKVVWWGKGDGGFLQEDAPNGDGKMLVKDCVLDKASAAVSEVTGTVTYLVRIALPPQATIQIQLQDVSQADAPATVIAGVGILLGNKQVPVPFALRYDAGKIDPKHRYSVSARVLIGTDLKFVTDQAYPVITLGNPTKVDLILKPAKP
jgi:putative lipoprotein